MLTSGVLAVVLVGMAVAHGSGTPPAGWRAAASVRGLMAGGRLAQTGTLSGTGASGPALRGVAASGRVVVAGAPTVGANDSQGALYVYRESAGGWVSGPPAAVLTASDGQMFDFLGLLGAPAIDGRTIVATSEARASAPGKGAVYVFEEPAGGWSGAVQQAAELTVSPGSRCQSLGPAIVSGSHVIATCDPHADGSLAIFTSPAGGWSGMLHETAVLRAPRGRRIAGDSVPVVNAGTVFATSVPASVGSTSPLQAAIPTALYGYREPARGWSGDVTSSTTLRLPHKTSIESVASSGDELFVATVSVTGSLSAAEGGTIYAFTRPANGWSGTVRPSARLRFGFAAIVPDLSVAASGHSVALSDTDLYGEAHQCPCGDNAATFREPAGGWYGTLFPNASRLLSTDTGESIAISGATMFQTDGPDIDLLRAPTSRSPASRPTAPVLSGTLTGIPSAQPTLRLHVRASDYQPPIRTITIIPPRGLTFAKSNAASAKDIGVRGARVASARLSARSLLVTFARATPNASISVRPPGVRTSDALRDSARRTRHALRPRFTVTSRDATGAVTHTTITIPGR